MTTPGKPVFGGGALRFPQVFSSNFNVANPSASPAQSWALFASGVAYFFGLVLSGGTITGPDYVINTSGIFIYSGAPAAGNLIGSWAGAAGTDGQGNAYPQGFSITKGSITGTTFTGTNFIINTAGAFFYSAAPAAGNLIASIAPAAGTDGFTNPYKAGVTVYGAASTFVEMVAGTPAMLNLGTGDAAEATPGQATTSIVGSGVTRTLTTRLFAPRVSGEAAGALTEVRLQSPSVDGTVSPTFQVIVNDGINVANLGIFTTGYQFSGGAITSNGGTAANPSLIVTDTWHTLAPVVTGYTVNQCRYRLQPDGTMLFDLQLTAGAGGGTAGTYVLTTTLPVQYQPIGSLARSYPVGYNATLVAGAFFGWLNIDEASSGNAGRVRLQIPGLAATSMIGTTAVVPLN